MRKLTIRDLLATLIATAAVVPFIGYYGSSHLGFDLLLSAG